MNRQILKTLVTSSCVTALVLVVTVASTSAQAPHAVQAWGFNDRGQLGDGTTRDIFTFVPPAQVIGLTNVTAIAGGADHSLALLADGTVVTWGVGQLDDGTVTLRSTPAPVSGLANVTAIAAGTLHSMALLADGTVMTWGFNCNGQLGDGADTDRVTPVKVSGLTNVTAIAAGSCNSFALLADGTVMGWGYGGSGEVGNGDTRVVVATPVPVINLANVTAIATAGEHTLALRADGTVMAWGTGPALGDGFGRDRPTPVQVSGLTNVTAIACGGEFGQGNPSSSFALLADGTVMAWGDNRDGELGDGTFTIRMTPGQLNGLANVTAIAGGGRHGLALLADGTVMAWGGRQGPVPTPVSGLANVLAIAGGGKHSLALF